MDEYGRGPTQHNFYPYTENGGTILGVAGNDFALVASDTRLSEGYSIYSRNVGKTYKLTDNTVLGCMGFHGDVKTLTKNIEIRLKYYEQDHNKPMSTNAVAAMLSTMLYHRRFFPLWTYNVVGGLDEEGKGAVYSYDPVGSYQREFFKAAGSAAALLQPLLDNQLGYKNMENSEHPALTLERAINLVKDVFISAAERDIYTGDGIVIDIITKGGIRREMFPLRRD